MHSIGRVYNVEINFGKDIMIAFIEMTQNPLARILYLNYVIEC
jgi:hypothetical protein